LVCIFEDMRAFVLFLVIFTCSTHLWGQHTPAYHPPLNIPLILAGNFGELRPNHFHMGLDFKTQGKEGLDLHAIEDGYVARVKVSSFGYGKVVYVNHPNGKTSVYAHCSKFVGKLDSLVKSEQYRLQKFEVELFPKPSDLPLKKGEIFALTGNTGGSSGPHLHFEIRDTKTEHAQNPLVYAFDLPDKRAPEIKKVKAFAVNEQGYLVPGKSFEKPIVKTVTGYTLTGDTLKIPSDYCSNFGGIGLAFDIIDRLDAAENQCGLYGTYLIVDGDTIFGQRTNEISFDNSRYINSHRDLSAMSSDYHKSFRNISNPLEIYIDKQLGVIHLQPDDCKQVQLVAYDPKGNTSTISFVLQALVGPVSTDFNPSAEKYWYPEEQYVKKTKTWEIIADSFTIYEPYALSSGSSAHICDVSTSLQKRMTVRMKLDNPKLPIEKYYIAGNTKSGKKALPTKYVNGWLEARTNNAGTFSIHTDEAPPVIKPITTSSTIKTKIVKFSVADGLSGIADYDLYIDSTWHLLEYEYKGSYVFFEVPDELVGEHDVKIVAKDVCGNESIWQRKMMFAIPVPATTPVKQ
jgi:hypothetical protein